jgi:hypothetical protein
LTSSYYDVNRELVVDLNSDGKKVILNEWRHLHTQDGPQTTLSIRKLNPFIKRQTPNPHNTKPYVLGLQERSVLYQFKSENHTYGIYFEMVDNPQENSNV